MKTIYLDPKSPRILGRRGDDNSVCVRADIEQWYTDFPGGIGTLIYTNPRRVTHPLDANLTEVDGKHYLEALITDYELQYAGWGVIMAAWYDGTTMVYSRGYSVKVMTNDAIPACHEKVCPDWVKRLIEEFGDLQTLIDQAAEIAEKIDYASEPVEHAEAWAVGTRSGVPVDSSDETYENNSKYYATLSAGSASEASGYATDAAAAQTAAEAAQAAAEHAAEATYVTPLMFGAVVGNNNKIVGDATQAIQDAVDTGKSIYFGPYEYTISGTINVNERKYYDFNAAGSTIRYTGTGTAFVFTNVYQSNIRFGALITSEEGSNGIDLIAESHDPLTRTTNSINNVYFNYIKANGYCISVQAIDNAYASEMCFFGGKITGAACGIKFLNGGMSHCKFYNIDSTGVTETAYLFNAPTSASGFSDFMWIGERTAENEGYVAEVTEGTKTNNFAFIDARDYRSKLKMSTQSTNWLMLSSSERSYGNADKWTRIGVERTLNSGQRINAGEDLNDYVRVGRYYTVSSSTTGSLQNRPGDVANQFRMIVENIYNSETVQTYIQDIIESGKCITWRRTLKNNNGDWEYGPWTCMAPIVAKNFTVTDVSLEAGERKKVDFNVANTGCSAIGLGGIYFPNTEKVNCCGWYFKNRSRIVLWLENEHTNTVSAAMSVTVLYLPYSTLNTDDPDSTDDDFYHG